MTAGSGVRVLVVDDSRTSRALLVGLCAAAPGVTVVGEGTNGRDAVEMVASLKPSIVVMDVDMPVMDGLEATRRIMRETPTPILIVTARPDARDVALGLRAVQAGALSVLPKPTGPGSPDHQADRARFARQVKALAGVRVVRRRHGDGAARSSPPPAITSAGGGPPLRAVGVGASTGGPAAVYRFLQLLPGGLSVPVLVVQHIAQGFTAGLVSWLAGATPLTVKLAEHGERLLGGSVYVAPDQCHLLASSGGRVLLSDRAAVEGFRPSVSVLFDSLAEVYGDRVAGVVLTGMGQDGLTGARALRAAGALVLAQDEGSSAVFGMPRAVAEAGLATAVGSVDQLAYSLIGRLPRSP